MILGLAAAITVIICRSKKRPRNLNAAKSRDSTHTGEGVRDEQEIAQGANVGENQDEI